MIPTLAGYPYLAVNLLGFGAVLAMLALAGPQRRTALAAGGIEALHAPLTPLFDQVYWSPARLGGGWMGIEDILLCFCLGVGSWVAASLPWRRRLVGRAGWRRAAWRLVVISVLSAPPSFALRALGLTTMETLIAGMLAVGAVLGLRRPDLVRIGLAGALAYPPVYVAIIVAGAALTPTLFAMWDGPELWGPRLAGLPLDEFAWVSAFAFAYPLIIATALDAEILPGRTARG